MSTQGESRMVAECPSCGAQQSMAWLCTDCCAAIETMLAAAPALIEQLDIAASKQVRLGVGSRVRTADTEDDGNDAGLAHTRSPVNWGAVAVRDALLVELALWGDDINEIRRHAQAEEIASGIGKVVKAAYQAIDRMQERKYLGKCMNQIGGLKCHEELWVRPNAKEVRCKSCQYEHNVANRRLDMIEMATDMLVTVKEASSYLGEIGDIRVTESSIRGYLHRGARLQYHAPVEAKRFRLGDLLTVVLDESERKSA